MKFKSLSAVLGESKSLMGHLICSILRGNKHKSSHAVDPKPPHHPLLFSHILCHKVELYDLLQRGSFM